MSSKRFSAAADNNKEAILNIIKKYLNQDCKVLEIGSGTGQHISYFARNCPDSHWQPADLIENHESIREWISELNNSEPPLELDINNTTRFEKFTNYFNLIYSANTSHIMSWQEVKLMLKFCANVVKVDGYVIIYGPFNKNNDFTSQSNQEFDRHLKSVNPSMGLRNMEDVIEIANKYKLELNSINDMPANNYTLVFRAV